MRSRPLETKEYPHEGYSADDAAQALLDGRARRKRRQYVACAVGVGVGTTIVIIAGWMGRPSWANPGWAIFAVSSVYALVLGIVHPTRACLHCGRQFEKRWEKGEGEMEDLFLVCDSCKKYVFAHEVRS